MSYEVSLNHSDGGFLMNLRTLKQKDGRTLSYFFGPKEQNKSYLGVFTLFSYKSKSRIVVDHSNIYPSQSVPPSNIFISHEIIMAYFWSITISIDYALTVIYSS